MPVAAGVVGDGRVRAGVVLAAGDMAAERRRAAALDCAHHLQLVETDVSAVGFTPSGTVVAEDIRDSRVGRPTSAALTPPVRAYASSSAAGACRQAARADSRWRRSDLWPHVCSAPSCPAWNAQAATCHNAVPSMSLKHKALLGGIRCYRAPRELLF